MSASNSTQPRGNGNGEANNPAETQGAQMSFSSSEIAQRAYEIYEREGRSDGRDMDHWLQAERELREERRQKRPATQNQEESRLTEQLRSGSASRPQRPDEAPRSARRHQASMV